MLRRRMAALEAEIAALKARITPQADDAVPWVTIGTKCAIDSSVRLLAEEGRPIVIGDRVKIYRGAEILGPVEIGAGTFMNRDAYVRPHTVIGRNVNFGPFVRVVTDTHDIGGPERRAGQVRHDAVHIGDGAWIGAGALILAGVTVGAGAVVAAGAVVVKDVPPHTVVAGTPARHVRDLES
jgi:maltose O-acetyltransferase